MDIPLWVEKIFFKTTDFISKIISQKKPTADKLKDLKIVSHRGHHDNRKIFENTFDSFSTAKDLGAWGIEFDIRWSKDEIPLVFHDKNTSRLFGMDKNICELNHSVIKNTFPLIPTFEEVVNAFGKKIHLMIEVKEFLNEEKKEQVQRILKDLTPVEDYHLLSLNPLILEQIDFVPEKTILPVAEVNLNFLSKKALTKGWGGLCGHYYFLSEKFIRAHHGSAQMIGTGHVNSKNCLYREINRGVDWIFTNDLKKLIP